MKRVLLPEIICLALVAARSFALAPAAPPPPSESAERAKYSVTRNAEGFENVFVGHYGEVLRLFDDWTAEAVMRGPMEIVYMRERTFPPATQWPKSIKRNDSGAVVTFHKPDFAMKREEFIPGNFARLRLMQMLVIPKTVPGGLPSLEKIREAKERELSATGSPYQLERQFAGDHNWPPDTFVVMISTPYPLFQLYTQSDKNFLIVTSGASPYDEHPVDPILKNSTALVLNSLSTYLDDFRLQIIAEKGFVKDLRLALLPGAAVCAFASLLCFLPKRRNWLGRLRLIGRATFGFTGAWHLLAVPVLFASWRLGLDRAINEASILLCASLIMPLVCKTISIRGGGQRPWRVFIWAAAANSALIYLGYGDMPDFINGTRTISGSQNFLSLSLVLGIMGLANGIIFGLTHNENKTEDPDGGGA